ncbi:MAG: noc [Haloplasmataceae bacterium]|jgi:ParB family chromosome partitioning protein|nr:noc [Haloplasmataceae bacterium]
MNIFLNSKDKIVNLKLSQIIANNKQPRSIFDEGKIKELADSIKEHGLLQPIIVRQKNNLFEIIAGERRFRACSSLNFETIPVIVKDFTDEEAASAALVENIQREDLSAIEEARAYKILMEINNLRQEDLAKKLGKAQSTIANKIRLLNLPDEIQETILVKKITERHARALLILKEKQLQLKVLEKIIEKDLTVKETEKYIEKLLDNNTNPKPRVVSKIPKDIRIAFNTIQHAVSLVEKMGLELTTNQDEDDMFYTYQIKIPKTK